MIPSVIAYAELAGLPPAHGLYAALAGMIAYAMFASSHQVIAGPDAAVTLLIAGAIGPIAGDDASKAVVLAAAIALIGGALMFLAAWLRAGVIADFLSKPVLVGYLTGAALILISTQLGKIFGIQTREHDFFPVIIEIVRRLSETHRATFGIGVGLIFMQVILLRLAPKIPIALSVSILAIVLSISFDLAGHGVRVLGDLPRGLPSFSLPRVSIHDFRQLIPAAAGIVMLTFPEGILLARAFAAKNGYEVGANRELVALAASNFSAGFFQGFSVGASQSRTVVADSVGGRSQLASLVAAAALGLFLLFLTPLLRPLPTVALAAILVFAGGRLIEIHEYRMLWRFSPLSFGLALIVALGVLVVGVVPGIVLGVMISLVYLLARLARPLDAVLREVPGTGRYHDLGEAEEPQTVPGLIAYRFYSALFFANAEYFVNRVRDLVQSSPTPIRWFVLDLQAVWDVDLTATEALSRLASELQRRNVVLCVARVNRPLREKFERIGLTKLLGSDNFYPSVHAAVAAFQRGSSEEGGRNE